MKAISKLRLDSCITTFSEDFEKQRKEVLNNLRGLTHPFYQDQFNYKQRRFIRAIITKLSVRNLMTLGLEDIEELILELGKTPNPTNKITLNKADKDKAIEKDDDEKKKNTQVSFQDLLVYKFNYSSYRNNFYPRLFSNLGIKSCVYCNSQLTLTVVKNTYTDRAGNLNGKAKIAKYQLDHVYSQKDYPYISATVFNLYPCCGVCNNIKRKKNVNFRLYSNLEQPSPYKFSLTKDSLAAYMVSHNSEELVVTFEDPDKPKPDKRGNGSLEDTFHISSIYNEQKDIAEEIIVRAQVYNDTYKKELEASFGAIFPGSGFSIERIFLGTYPDEKDIHKRPLSKFIQDISSEVRRLSMEINILK